MSKPEPARYRTTNWQSSNDVLQRRGSLLVWLGREMDWLAPKAVKPGRPRVFSDAATQFCLMIKVLFGRPLRPTASANDLNGRQLHRDGWSGLAGPGLLHARPPSEDNRGPAFVALGPGGAAQAR